MLRFRPLGRFVNECYRHRRNSFPSLLPSPQFHAVESFSSFSSTSSVSPSSSMSIWRLLSRSLLFGIGSLGAIGYVSYAYTFDELDTKTRDFRNSVYSDRPNPFFSTIKDSSPSFSMALADSFRESVKREKDGIFLGTCRFLISSVMGVAAYAMLTYLILRVFIEDYVLDYPMEPLPNKLLPDMDLDMHKCTLVLDLNDTLVHSDWIVDFRKRRHSVKRPELDDFLELVSEMGYYEIVLYTDEPLALVRAFRSIMKSGDTFSHILTRRANICTQDEKCYRDLSKLNRDPSRILYVSSHALETCLQPENCVPIKPWKKEDVDDTTLTDLLEFLVYIACKRPNDVRPLLSTFKGNDIASEFVERSKHQQRRFFGNGRLWGF